MHARGPVEWSMHPARRGRTTARRRARSPSRLTTPAAPSSVRRVLRVGTDLASVPEVRDAIAAHGERYLRRIYTPEELEDARGEPQRLAARFAAKEAVLKVLRPGDDALPWKEIRVRRHPGGWTDLVLSGRAAERAREAGLVEWAVSLTHEGDLASAVVIATTGPAPTQDPKDHA